MSSGLFFRKTMASWSLWFLPVILMLVGWATYFQMFPIGNGGSGYDEDPAYVYLINGLYLLEGHIPGHIDHPGTPLQILGAATIFLRWGISWIMGIVQGDVATEVFRDPELYMATIGAVLLFLNVGALYYLGRRILQVTESYRLALLVQTAPFIFGLLLIPRAIYLSPEALLIFASLCLLGVLAGDVFRPLEDETQRNKLTPVLAGAICGFGLAVKLTFLPMLGLLLLLHSYRRFFQAVGYALVSFIVCVLPILPNLLVYFRWVRNIAKHTGRNGSGSEGVVDWGAVPSNFLALLKAFPFLYFVVCALAMAMVLMWWRDRSEKNDKRGHLIVPAVLILVMLVQTLLVIKDFGLHYMVPVMPVSLIGVAWLIWTNPAKGLVARMMPAALLGVCCTIGAVATFNMLGALYGSRVLAEQEQALISGEMNRHKDPFVIGTYRSLLPKSAICFGLFYTRGELTEAARPFLENFDEYNMWSKSMFLSSPERINQIISTGKDVLLVSPNYYPQPDAFILEPLVNVSNRTLYRVISMHNSVQ
ncbi:glycosyltransferase 87 family protein [Sulfuricella denitrificans]|uniref:glycosyltransferase 87 family protein n=1 Tax=Sulfuricella denitrificans TaxID=649841 RepID=UPI00030D7E2A|nr:glycosyltransferase 87 family protein [Sulfuricella denitrificans]